MAEILNTSVFSQTDANNNSGTVPTFAEGMAPSQVNDSARALMGAITREANWRNPTLTTTGSANAYVLTYSVAPAALYNGQTFAFYTNFANTGSATLNINTIGAKTIKKVVAGTKTALSSGDVASGALLKVAYNTSDDSFVILTGIASGIAASDNIAFSGTNTHAGTETFNAAATFNAATSVANTLTISKEILLSGDLSPAQITSNQTDYAPTNHATAFRFRLDLDAARTINSLAGQVAGRVVEILNTSAFTLTLLHDDGATGTAAMRFSFPDSDSLRIRAGGSAFLHYDGTSSRWRPAGVWLSAAGQSSMEAASVSSQFVSPAVQHNHPGHPKYWAFVTVSGGTPTAQTSYNLTSITDAGVGQLTTTIATDFSSANWCPFGIVQTTTANDRYCNATTVAAGTATFECSTGSGGGTVSDPLAWGVGGLGDQ